MRCDVPSPSTTITAMAERALSFWPSAASRTRVAALGGGAAQLTLVEDPAAVGADGAFHLVGNSRPLP